jgi:hypothetical protein
VPDPTSSGLVPVQPVQPEIRALFDKVKDFQARVRGSRGTQADRDRIYRLLEGWLYELKMLSLIAYDYKEQHDFYNALCMKAWFTPDGERVPIPDNATERHRFQHANNLTLTALRREIETFHLYTSILLDRIPRILPAYFGDEKSLGNVTHDKFWKDYKRRAERVPFITEQLQKDGNWLQDEMDWYRNRVITHPEGYEKEGFIQRGMKNRPNENLRLFARRPGDASTNFKDTDRESATLEEIVPRLVSYVGGFIDLLDEHAAQSVLLDPSRPRPELVARNAKSVQPDAQDVPRNDGG